MNNNKTGSASSSDKSDQWEGYTIDELRVKRAMAAVKSEIGKERIMSKLTDAKTQVDNDGLRSMIFGGKMLSGLKTVDYVILGYKTSKLAWRLWHKFSGPRK